MIFGCPRRKIGIVKQSWPIRNRCDCFTMPVFRLRQPKIVQCISGLRYGHAHQTVASERCVKKCIQFWLSLLWWLWVVKTHLKMLATQGRCWSKGCPKQDCIIVFPFLKYYGSKIKNTYYRIQNRTLIKYQSKYILLFTNYNCSFRQLPMAIILLIQMSDWFYILKQKKIKQFY